jgi:hypothetical protein
MNFLSKFRAIVIASVFAVAALVPAAHAQSGSAQGNTVKVNVPFAFSCGPQHYTAGTYLIRDRSSNVVSILGKSRSGLAMTRIEQAYRPATVNKAVFRKYGDTYFLEELWTAGNTSHVTVAHAKAKKTAEVASNATVPVVELALLEMPRK